MRILKDNLNIGSRKKLMKEVHSIGHWEVNPYAQTRLSERSIPVQDAVGVCREGELIEYHNEKGTRRVLLRSPEGTCVVVDLDTHNIVTAYTNDPTNNHPNLQRQNYLFG